MNLTIKNVPPELHRKLKARAMANKRSVGAEVLDILESTLGGEPENLEMLMQEVDAINARLKLPPLTEEFLRMAKNEGRP